MKTIYKPSSLLRSLALTAGLASSALTALAATPPDAQAQAQRLVVGAVLTPVRHTDVAAANLDLQTQANRVMIVRPSTNSTHWTPTTTAHLDAQESARRIIEGSRGTKPSGSRASAI